MIIKISDLVVSKRKTLGESQGKFAKRFNLSHAAISDIERGAKTSIRQDMLNFVLDVSMLPKPAFSICEKCGGKGYLLNNHIDK